MHGSHICDGRWGYGWGCWSLNVRGKGKGKRIICIIGIFHEPFWTDAIQQIADGVMETGM
jgi:hypothetical protein